jgi:O-antigen/teichoic acid export membrane protein
LRRFDLFQWSSYSGGVAAQLITAAIRIPVELLVPIAIGRILGPTAVGSYAMIFLVSTYIGYGADFGISYLLIREISRYSAQIKSWVSSAFIVGGIVSLGLLSLVILVAIILFGATYLCAEILCAVLSAIILALGSYYVSAFYASSRMQYETIGVLFQSLIYGSLSLLGLTHGWGLPFVFLSLLISRLTFFVVCRSLYRRMVELVPDTNVKKVREIWHESPPFLVHNVFSMVSTRVDILMLGAMAGPRQVGYYEPASGFVTRLPFIARALTNSSFPVLSGLLPSQQDRARNHSHTLTIRLLMLSFPMAVWIFWAASRLTYISYGPAFAPTAICLRILAILIPLQFIDNGLGMIASAGNKQRERAKIVIVASIVNLLLNIALIPKFGYVATSVSSVISELVIFGWMLKYARQILNGAPFTVRDLVSIMAGAASMILVLGLLSNLQIGVVPSLAVSFLSLVPCLVIYVWLGLIGPSGTAVKVRFPSRHPSFEIGKE